MKKSALALVISVCVGLFVSPAVWAEDGATAQSPAKQGQKKNKSKNTKSAKSKKKGHSASNTAAAPQNKVIKRVSVDGGKRTVSYHRVSYAPTARVAPQPPLLSAGDLAGLKATHDPLSLASNVAFVVDQSNSQVLFEKNSTVALPIASLTKLMTALLVVEAHQDMNEVLEVTEEDVDREKHSSSRLRVGAKMTRANMLHIALMSSENRAASALGRNYPGGFAVFVDAMNAKAKSLGMMDTRYVDATGLSSHNVASARDLAKLVMVAYQQPILREYSTDPKYIVDAGGRMLQYTNSNRLVNQPDWEIGLQKTGYINEAGRCLVMQAKIEGRSVVMVFLDSKGKLSRIADAARMRKWLEMSKPQIIQVNAQQS